MVVAASSRHFRYCALSEYLCKTTLLCAKCFGKTMRIVLTIFKNVLLSLTGLVCYSLRTCSLRCPYGRMVDRDGCELCMCKIFCDLDPCPSTYCPHGKAKDGNGCPICQCNPDPCYVSHRTASVMFLSGNAVPTAFLPRLCFLEYFIWILHGYAIRM